MQYDIYDYRFSKKEVRENAAAKHLIQYVFQVNCLNKKCDLNYLLNLYEYKSYLYITDIFPAVWENDDECFHKLISMEGYTVNFRKIAITCLMIFHEKISPHNINAAMVISGSYVKGEKPDPVLNISRKLKLYWNLFKPIAAELNYKFVEVLNYNAVILINRNCNITEEKIIADYIEFKNK
jgi:hypothetical protein